MKDARSTLQSHILTPPGTYAESVKADTSPHSCKIFSFRNTKDTEIRKNIYALEQLSSRPFDGVVEKVKQCRGRNQRRVRNKICFFYLLLLGHLELFQFLFMNALRMLNNIASHCKGIIIRYIHHQDGDPLSFILHFL